MSQQGAPSWLRTTLNQARMSSGTFALGSKVCAARMAFPAATFPMGIARSTTCERELIGFQSMVCGGGCRKKRSFETPETRLDGIDGSENFLRASESYHSLVCSALCVQFTF